MSKKQWFYKTTHKIRTKERIPLRSFSGFGVVSVSAGIDLVTGYVYINYKTKWNIHFVHKHFHEFLHRLFWLLHFELGHDIIDKIDSIIYWTYIRKLIRINFILNKQKRFYME